MTPKQDRDRITLDLTGIKEAVESAYASSLWHELSMPQKVRYIVKAFLGLVEPSEEMALPHHRSSKAIKRFCDGWDLQKLERASGIPSERLLEFRSGQWSRAIDANEATGLIRAGIAPEELKVYFEKEVEHGNNGS